MTGSITNHGLIDGAEGVYVSQSTVSGGINNSGTISGTSQAAIKISGSTVSGGITNSGTISGITGSSNHAAVPGLLISNTSTINGGITNSGTISSIGGAAIEINQKSTVNGGINNSGTISGKSAGLAIGSPIQAVAIPAIISKSAAQLIPPVTTINGGITNSGTISSSQTGILLNADSKIDGITNSGLISGTVKSVDLQNTANAFTITNTGTISGPAAIGINTLDLNGNNARVLGSVTGTIDSKVNVNGTFTSEDSFHVGEFNIASGGVFNMKHEVELLQVTTFSNHGTLSVAADDTVTISGSGHYVQDANAVFRTNVTNDTTYGKLVTTGLVDLPTNAKIDVNVLNPNFNFTTTRMEKIISTTGTLKSDGSFMVTDNSLLFDFSAAKVGNAVDLTLERAKAGVYDATLANGFIPGLGSARAIDASPEQLALFGKLGTTQQVANAVSQTLPLMISGQTLVTRSTLRNINLIVQSRQDGQHGRSSGDQFYGNKGGWFKPFGSWAGQDNRGGVSGYDANTWGMVFGADTELSRVNRLGVAFAYANSSIDSKSTVAPQSSDVNTYRFISYGSHSLGENTDLNAQADFGYHNTNGQRHITFVDRLASSNYDSWSGHFGVGLAHTLNLTQKTNFTPSARADYTVLSEAGYTETGAGNLNLTNGAKKAHELIVGLDGKLVHALNNLLTVTANAGVGFDTMNQKAQLISSFSGSPQASFVTNGINPSPWLGRFGFGLVSKPGDNLELSARYDSEIRENFSNQTASIKARLAF